jgi:hypothetical protein
MVSFWWLEMLVITHMHLNISVMPLCTLNVLYMLLNIARYIDVTYAELLCNHD